MQNNLVVYNEESRHVIDCWWAGCGASSSYVWTREWI